MELKKILFTLLFFVLSINLFSQDIIYLKDFSDSILCSIVKDNIITLEFRYWDSSDSVIHTLKGNEIEYYLIREKKNIPDIVNEDSSLVLSENRFVNDFKKVEFELKPMTLDEILKSNIKGHIQLKRWLQWSPRLYPPFFVRYNFDVDEVGNSRVGMGGGKLKPFLVNDNEVKRSISTYTVLRESGFILMNVVPWTIIGVGVMNEADGEVFMPLFICSYVTGKIIYHGISKIFLRKAINRHNAIVKEMRATIH